MHKCAFAQISVHRPICVPVHRWMYKCVNLQLHAEAYVCTCTVCMHVCSFVCMCTSVCLEFTAEV